MMWIIATIVISKGQLLAVVIILAAATLAFWLWDTGLWELFVEPVLSGAIIFGVVFPAARCWGKVRRSVSRIWRSIKYGRLRRLTDDRQQ
jgi:hypothetical protein